MDTSYLAQQVNTIIGQLHGLFDEIGVANHERESRESELFTALSEALHNQVRVVAAEKKDMIEEAQRILAAIRQMEASLDDSNPPRRDYAPDEDELKITYPLTRCLQVLKEKHTQISRLHRERFEQVKKLVQALESYSLHLEPSFVRLTLPPTGPNQSIPASFDLSPKYVDKLDKEFTRVYEEYTRRVAEVKSLSEEIIQLWAELGTPQAQTDSNIVKYYRDSPEQLGLHADDMSRLRARRDKLSDEKKNRERRLRDLRAAVEALWEKLSVEERERKAFLNGNRGCGVRQINEFEDELARLNELKRQNLHLFVEDARFKLQELWDALYLSEDEMLEFTPAFSDVYSDALLEAHEQELARLEALREQRGPTLALVERHRTLVHDRDELAASSQDASRLMMRGQKGEKRDPGKLLREEKMRKRIAKELPKVAAELRKGLEKWEDEYGRPFLVHGERYLDIIDMDEARPGLGPRSKTPAPTPSVAKSSNNTLSRANSVGNLKSAAKITASRAPAATMTSTVKPAQPRTQTTANNKGSPSRIPARVPLSNLKHGNNSPERSRPESRVEAGNGLRHGAPLLRAPPPKMRDLMPPPELATPANHYRSAGLESSIVRHVEPEDVYDDRQLGNRPASRDYYQQAERPGTGAQKMSSSSYPQAPPPPAMGGGGGAPRQISNTSTIVSGSENWETYDDNSEPEADASDAYYAKVRAARAGKRMTPETGYSRPHAGGPAAKRPRGFPPGYPHHQQHPASHAHAGHVMVDHEGNRIVSGVSGSEWTDEDAF
ncbi:microtubule associated protein-domain-containing protein [Lasiosphaeria ovina]|uniref:Microtubule associated protein-domain-containing protein n=1 Tax=Lasiosphaeria ovina TaxID=92902 RepID=A0AAE0TT36_9PEZI|nr:microtubule associated protein-domain-containing protein [Lasiosphaeria ovina]